MATEYYIVKPDKKQVFYLGKRIANLDGIPSWQHTQKADYCKWEYYGDVFLDIYENSSYFMEYDITINQIHDFCACIHNFCDAAVYLDNDCSDNFVNWKDYEEIDVYSDILCTEEKVNELVCTMIPREQWVTKDHIIDVIATLKQFIENRR